MVVCGIRVPFKKISKLCKTYLVKVVGMIVIFDLEGLTVNLLALNHLEIFSRSALIISLKPSSAKSLETHVMNDSRSLTSIKSNKGPRVKPLMNKNCFFC